MWDPDDRVGVEGAAALAAPAQCARRADGSAVLAVEQPDAVGKLKRQVEVECFVYSLLSDCAGSSREARTAGHSDARSPVAARQPATDA